MEETRKLEAGLVARADPNDDARLALLALFIAATRCADGCAARLDAATAIASHASRTVIEAAGIRSTVSARFGAARALNGLCGACARCPRGVGMEARALTAPSP